MKFWLWVGLNSEPILGTVSLNHTVLLIAFLRLEWVGGGPVTNKVCDEKDVS